MPIAYQEQSQLTCPACGAAFTAALWLILDAQEEPEAVEALLREELNLVTCTACGQRGPAAAPLLFHDALARRVIFAPTPGAAEHAWREQARALHAMLVAALPEDARRPYLGDVDIAQDLAGVAHLLRRAAQRRQRGDGFGEGKTLPENHPPMVPPLLIAVEALLAANDMAELDHVLATYPLLLDPENATILMQLEEVALEQRSHEVATSLRQARALLQQMAALAQTTPSALPAVASVLAQAEAVALPLTSGPEAPPPASRPIGEEVFTALLHAQSAAELAAVVTHYPALAQPNAAMLLAERIELALEEGNERLALLLEERREALLHLHRAPPYNDARLTAALEALLLAEGEMELADALDAYPILLEEPAAQALWQVAAEARASGDEELARYALECRTMLQRVRDGLKE
ncbi:MAG: hypothetical protein EI684_22220 [Candidatus Viridilinea halotolerans]|uniref:CpXC domain-containing protein n=1 Tax=Candidatus Viridilinea halotolerans TaxID=2491704 RepID=A0A426TQY3_9CHLR|nr:MAG: hypothetical protein EI684_22220 [Candidatus Viridilinea halotolerans]